MIDYDRLALECENWIRGGQALKSAHALKKLNFAKVPRAKLATLCALARRSNAVAIGLKNLRPFVRPSSIHAKKANSAELIEYAMELNRVGAFSEADLILQDSRLSTEPKALLARAFACMLQWNYDEALSYLDAYLGFEDLTNYERLTAQVNRLACLKFLSDPRFTRLYEELRKTLEQEGHHLLLANTLETFSQHLIDNQAWSEAESVLKAAEKLLLEEHGRPLLFVRKWQRILSALRKNSITDLESFRAEAAELHDWETMRDLDFHQTRLDPECLWANKVYYGTPYPSFRRKLEKIRDYPAAEWYGSGDVSLDPWFPKNNEGDLAHRTMILFLRDLYRPIGPGEIFANIHQDEYFDIASLSVRVRQIISRCRTWVEENSFPLRLQSIDQQYRMQLMPHGKIVLRSQTLRLDKIHFFFERHRGLPTANLSIEEWASVMGVKATAAGRFLRAAAEAGAVSKVSTGRTVIYSVR